MTWVFTAVSLLGTVLNVQKLRICFMFWIVGNICWLAYDISLGLYSRAILDIVQLSLAIWGWIAWGQDEEEV